MRNIGSRTLDDVRQEIKSSRAQVREKSEAIEHVRRIPAEDASAHSQASAGQSSDAQEINDRLTPLPQQQVSQPRNGPTCDRCGDSERRIACALLIFDCFAHVDFPQASSASISVCTAPVTSAFRSSTYTLTSLRTPNSGR